MEGEGEMWFVGYRVEDLTTRQLVLERDLETGSLLRNAPVFAGAEYNITVTLDIGLTAAYANLTLRLSLLHADSIDRFWEIHTANLSLAGGYNPNVAEITFSQVKGRYVISTFGRVPSDLTITPLGSGLTLHRPVNFTVIRLIGPDGAVLDEISLNIIDSEIDGYRFIRGEKERELQGYKESRVDPAYIELFENFLRLADEQSEVGFVRNAVDILEALEVEVPPVQTGPSLAERYFLPSVGGLGVLSVALASLLVRARGKASYVSMIVDDQIREMEALTTRAKRIDRSLASRLQEISDRLKETERI
ncbi:MAG: hypothetical protein ACE5OO_04260 [Candidatus Bathyarchaeia archaeon]